MCSLHTLETPIITADITTDVTPVITTDITIDITTDFTPDIIVLLPPTVETAASQRR